MKFTPFSVLVIVLLAFSFQTKAEEPAAGTVPTPAATASPADDTPETGTGETPPSTGETPPSTGDATSAPGEEDPAAAQGSETTAPAINEDPCGTFTGKDECCLNTTAAANNCTFCAAPDSAENATCSSTCDSPGLNLCLAPEPVLGCSNFNDSADCCSSNCSFCVVSGAVDGVCVDQGMCGDQGEENCTAPVPATTQAPIGPTGGSETTPGSNDTTTTPGTDTTSSESKGGDSGGQRFDGASFIGGIILCGGLVALVFFGMKFYKARKDQNYHTL